MDNDHKVYVVDVTACPDDDVDELFEHNNIDIVESRLIGNSALITLSSAEAAKDAISFFRGKSFVGNRPIEIYPADEKLPPIIVERLPRDMTSSQLAILMKKLGTVTEINVTNNGLSSSAIVRLSSIAETKKACKLNGKTLFEECGAITVSRFVDLTPPTPAAPQALPPVAGELATTTTATTQQYTNTDNTPNSRNHHGPPVVTLPTSIPAVATPLKEGQHPTLEIEQQPNNKQDSPSRRELAHSKAESLVAALAPLAKKASKQSKKPELIDLNKIASITSEAFENEADEPDWFADSSSSGEDVIPPPNFASSMPAVPSTATTLSPNMAATFSSPALQFSRPTHLTTTTTAAASGPTTATAATQQQQATGTAGGGASGGIGGVVSTLSHTPVAASAVIVGWAHQQPVMATPQVGPSSVMLPNTTMSGGGGGGGHSSGILGPPPTNTNPTSCTSTSTPLVPAALCNKSGGNLMVANLPHWVTPATIRQMCSAFGAVECASLRTLPDTTGLAIVTFCNPNSVATCMEGLAGTKLGPEVLRLVPIPPNIAVIFGQYATAIDRTPTTTTTTTDGAGGSANSTTTITGATATAFAPTTIPVTQPQAHIGHHHMFATFDTSNLELPQSSQDLATIGTTGTSANTVAAAAAALAAQQQQQSSIGNDSVSFLLEHLAVVAPRREPHSAPASQIIPVALLPELNPSPSSSMILNPSQCPP